MTQNDRSGGDLLTLHIHVNAMAANNRHADFDPNTALGCDSGDSYVCFERHRTPDGGSFSIACLLHRRSKTKFGNGSSKRFKAVYAVEVVVNVLSCELGHVGPFVLGGRAEPPLNISDNFQ